MKAERVREKFLTALNEFDDGLMKTGDRCFHIGKTGDRCFHIGIGGECGLRFAAFCDGECQRPYEFELTDIMEEFYDEELLEIYNMYPGFRPETD